MRLTDMLRGPSFVNKDWAAQICTRWVWAPSWSIGCGRLMFNGLMFSVSMGIVHIREYLTDFLLTTATHKILTFGMKIRCCVLIMWIANEFKDRQIRIRDNEALYRWTDHWLTCVGRFWCNIFSVLNHFSQTIQTILTRHWREFPCYGIWGSIH